MRVLLWIRDWISIQCAGLNMVSVIYDVELFSAAAKVCATEQQLMSVVKMESYSGTPGVHVCKQIK